MQSILSTVLTLRARLVDAKQKEHGATAVEYGLLVSLIAVAIMVTVGLLGDQLNAVFESVLEALGGGEEEG